MGEVEGGRGERRKRERERGGVGGGCVWVGVDVGVRVGVVRLGGWVVERVWVVVMVLVVVVVMVVWCVWVGWGGVRWGGVCVCGCREGGGGERGESSNPLTCGVGDGDGGGGGVCGAGSECGWGGGEVSGRSSYFFVFLCDVRPPERRADQLVLQPSGPSQLAAAPSSHRASRPSLLTIEQPWHRARGRTVRHLRC